MTASTVNGLAVVATEPALSGWKNHATGVPLEFKQILKLLLEDGSEVYGCLHCDYTAPHPKNVRPHLNKHRDLKAAPNGAAISVSDLIRQLTETEHAEKERNLWKARALLAERELRRLRAAFSTLGGH